MRLNPALKLSFLIMLLLSACTTANGPLFMYEPISADADPSLFLYRPSSTLMAGAKWEFLIDKDVVVNLSNGTYVKVPLKPGNHELMAAGAPDVDQPPFILNFEAIRGKNAYVKYEMKTKHGVFVAVFVDRPKFNNLLYEVDEAQALTELKELRFSTLPQRKY